MFNKNKKLLNNRRSFFVKNHSYSQKKCLAFIFSIIVLLLFLNLTVFPEQIKNSFYYISEPVQEWLWSKGLFFSDFFEGTTRGFQIKKENNYLLNQNSDLINQNIELEKLKEENETFRIALGLSLEETFDLEMARVIGKDISENIIIINKGAEDGLRFNLPLITEGKVLVGRIVEVYENVSKVQLLSSRESLIDIEVFDKDVYALLKGKNSLDYFLDLIPNDSEVNSGDLVITSGFSGDFPKGLLVGMIESIKDSETVSFKEAIVKPSMNIQELSSVFIILSSDF